MFFLFFRPLTRDSSRFFFFNEIIRPRSDTVDWDYPTAAVNYHYDGIFFFLRRPIEPIVCSGDPNPKSPSRVGFVENSRTKRFSGEGRKIKRRVVLRILSFLRRRTELATCVLNISSYDSSKRLRVWPIDDRGEKITRFNALLISTAADLRRFAIEHVINYYSYDTILFLLLCSQCPLKYAFERKTSLGFFFLFFFKIQFNKRRLCVDDNYSRANGINSMRSKIIISHFVYTDTPRRVTDFVDRNKPKDEINDLLFFFF